VVSRSAPLAGAERDEGLHGPLAKGSRAENGCTFVILQGACHDLGGRGRTAIDQHDHRLALGEIAAGAGIEPLSLVRIAAAS
jgi:hypothetical protein